jgi:hypothetical protein
MYCNLKLYDDRVSTVFKRIQPNSRVPSVVYGLLRICASSIYDGSGRGRKEGERADRNLIYEYKTWNAYFPSNSSGGVQYLQVSSHFTSVTLLKIKSLLLQCNY